jgi:AcrR family transcriptional regulator
MKTDKRTLIKNAALKLFIEKGFQNTSTANISKEAGVATGTLFIYFPTKEQLMNALYKESKEEFGISLEDGFPLEGNTQKKFRHLWSKAIDWAMQNNEAFRFIQMFKTSPLISNLTREEIASSAEFAITFIRQGIKSGEIVEIDIELLLTIIDGLLAATVNFISLKPAKMRQQYIEQSFNIFWNGVSKQN